MVVVWPEGKKAGMGGIWGPGGWAGPGSRYQRWSDEHWWSFSLLYGIIAAILWFPIVYFDLFGLGEDSRHRLLPSLLRALLAGALFGLVRLGMKWWERRIVEREC